MTQVLRLRLGDCLDVLKTMEAGSVGTFLLDPPYGLEFMGKEWDAPWKYTIADYGFSDGGDRRPAPSFSSSRNPTCRNCGKRQRTWKGGPPACECGAADFDNDTAFEMKGYQGWCVTWLAECFRVLPPGGILKAFSGTRTYHRLAAAMEAVGFVLEPGDSLNAWAYGSGFPKSLNVSKAIDKAGQAKSKDIEHFRHALAEARETKHMTRAEVSEAITGNRSGACWNWESGLRVPIGPHWNALVKLLDLPPGVAGLRDAAERAILGKGGAGLGRGQPAHEGGFKAEYDLTAPATDDAKRFEGWGTALKPSWEPVMVGRKPL